MLDEILNSPTLSANIVSFHGGETIFSEGDTSQDLYILASGEIEVLKGDKRLTVISEKGSLFGEMSFLLKSARTATVRAKTHINVLKIKADSITRFLLDYPQVASVITRNLAERLDQTSQALYGLGELCDHMPDAVIITDPECRILFWNKPAEELYGKSRDQIKELKIYQIYADTVEAERAFKDFGPGSPPTKSILKVSHPSKGERTVEVATKAISDSRGVFHGMVSSARDITEMVAAAKKYRKIRYRVIPLILLFASMVAISFYGYNILTGRHTSYQSGNRLKAIMAKDYLFLSSLMAQPLKEDDMEAAGRIIRDFAKTDPYESPYRGFMLIDSKKTVRYALIRDTASDDLIGSSYAGILATPGNSAQTVLTLYRVTKKSPMGEKSIEAAFVIKADGLVLGWIVFVMEMEFVTNEFNLGEKDLKAMQFELLER